MAGDAPDMPAAAVRAIGRGIPADRVLMPDIDLTPKQRQFVRALASGSSKRDAYLEAYDTAKDSRSVGITACHVAAQPKIQAALQQQRAVERLRYSQNPVDIRGFVVDSLQHEARTAQRPADRLRALELLGRLADVGAFEHRTVVEHRSGDTAARLRDKLARLAGVVDVEAHTPTHAGTHAPAGVPAHAHAHEGDPTPGGEGQTGRGVGGDARSNNPHIPSDNPTESASQTGYPQASDLTPPIGGVNAGDIPLEEEKGTHTGGSKKKEKPIWQDPKRWYAATMGEVPKIEWAPREDARDEIQKRLRDDEGGG